MWCELSIIDMFHKEHINLHLYNLATISVLFVCLFKFANSDLGRISSWIL